MTMKYCECLRAPSITVGKDKFPTTVHKVINRERDAKPQTARELPERISLQRKRVVSERKMRKR